MLQANELESTINEINPPDYKHFAYSGKFTLYILDILYKVCFILCYFTVILPNECTCNFKQINAHVHLLEINVHLNIVKLMNTLKLCNILMY